MSLLRRGKAQALTIYLGESDQWQGRPLYVAMIQLLREQGCAGATATRAVAGYGAGVKLHESGHLRLSSDATIVIQIVDQSERLQRLRPRLEEMLGGGLMTLHEVEVLKYTHARRRGLPANLTVKQVMETLVTTVGPETALASVIDLLLAAPFRVLPVVDNQQRLQGIISTGDLINAGVLPMRRGLVRTALELDTLTVETVGNPLAVARQSARTAQDIMNGQVRTVKANEPVRQAAQIMIESGLRRLPVIEDDGTLVGMLTRADLLQIVVSSPLMSSQSSSGMQPLRQTGSLSQQAVQQRNIAEYITPDVVAVNEWTPLDEVIDDLIVSPLKRVVVVDNERHVKGIISDVDILSRMQAELRPGLLSLLTDWARGRQRTSPGAGTRSAKPQKAQIAADIMNREVITVSVTTSVQKCIERMLATHRKFLPVVDREGKLIGVIGRSDLLRVLIEDNNG